MRGLNGTGPAGMGTPANRDAASRMAVATGSSRPSRYRAEPGLDLGTSRERDLFLWFIAAMPFGRRISQSMARRMHRAAARHKLPYPERILAADTTAVCANRAPSGQGRSRVLADRVQECAAPRRAALALRCQGAGCRAA